MGNNADSHKGVATTAAPTFLPSQLHGVLANEIRHEILMRCAERPWSATELADALELPRRQITDQIEELKKTDPPLLEFVGKKPSPKRGSMHMYQATRFIVDADQWANLSPIEQAVSSANIVGMLTDELSRALRDGTLYASPNHHLLRDRHILDDAGMAAVNEIFLEAHERAVAVAAESAERLSESEDRPIPVTMGLICVEAAPKGSESTPKNPGS